MSRISRLDRSEVTSDLAALFDKAFAQRGNVPNMFRVMAHRPEIFATMQAHFGITMIAFLTVITAGVVVITIYANRWWKSVLLKRSGENPSGPSGPA